MHLRVRHVRAHVARRLEGVGVGPHAAVAGRGGLGVAPCCVGIGVDISVRTHAGLFVERTGPGRARPRYADPVPIRPVRGGDTHRRGRARVAPRRVRRPVCDRDRRPDPARRRSASQTAGHGAGPLRAGVRELARGARRTLPRPCRGRGHGRVLRLEASRRAHAGPRGRGHRPVPRRASGRRQAHHGALAACNARPPEDAASKANASTTVDARCSKPPRYAPHARGNASTRCWQTPSTTR